MKVLNSVLLYLRKDELMPDSRNLYIAIGRHMMMLDKQLKKHLREALKDHGLGSTESMVLLHLIRFPAQSQDLMIEAMGFDKGVMTRTMQFLEREGYVLRHKHSRDQRAFIFTVTDKTTGIQEVLFSAMESWRKKVTVDLQQTDLVELERLLSAMTKTFNRTD